MPRGRRNRAGHEYSSRRAIPPVSHSSGIDILPRAIPQLSDEALNLALSARRLALRGSRTQREARLSSALSPFTSWDSSRGQATSQEDFPTLRRWRIPHTPSLARNSRAQASLLSSSTRCNASSPPRLTRSLFQRHRRSGVILRHQLCQLHEQLLVWIMRNWPYPRHTHMQMSHCVFVLICLLLC